MPVATGLIRALQSAAAQVDPNAGTLQAYKGATARIAEPNMYDAVFPFIALGLVIVIPSAIALWVIYKTITDPTKEPDEI